MFFKKNIADDNSEVEVEFDDWKESSGDNAERNKTIRNLIKGFANKKSNAKEDEDVIFEDEEDSAIEDDEGRDNMHDVLKRTSGKKKKLMKIQSTQAFSPIRDINKGIVCTKDRRFVKILEVMPINFALRSTSEQEAIIQEFAAALRTMPVKIQFKIISKKADSSKFIQKINNDIKTEKNKNCRILQQEQIDLISRVSAAEGVSRRFFIAFNYTEPSGMKHSPSFEDIQYDLDNIAFRIKNMLVSCGNEVRALNDDDEIMELFYEIMCRKEAESTSFNSKKLEVISRYIADDNYTPGDNYIPVNDFLAPESIDVKESPKYMIVDGKYYCYAYLPSSAYPINNQAGWFSILANLGEGVDVDLFIRKEPIDKIQTKLQFALRYNQLRAHSIDDTSMEFDELSTTINSGYYLKQGIAQGDDFCYMAVLLTIMADDPESLAYKINEIKLYLLSRDMKLKLCWFQQEQSFLMSLPICKWDDNIFEKSKRNVLSSSLASAYPFVSFEVSDENGILMGINRANNSLVFVDNFDSQKYKNANMAILGTSGAGKTYTLQCMALRMRQKKTQVFIIAPDKGHEFKRACSAIGGEYVKICAGSGQNINIMEIRKLDYSNTMLLDGQDSLDYSILAAKIQQIHTFFSLLIPNITYEETQLLDEALIRTYKSYGITNDNESLIANKETGEYKEMPILGDLQKELGKTGDAGKRLYNILARYVNGSADSFNMRTNVNLDNKYIVLDVSDLTGELLKVGMFIVLDYVWDKVREDRTTRKAVFLDELWKLIGSKSSEEAADFVLEIFKVIRGYGGSAIAATQDLNDFFALDNGSYGKGIINNAKIKFIMQLETEEAARVENTLGLSRVEIQQVTHFQRGEGLLMANSNHVLVDFKSSKNENELITTDREQLAKQAQKRSVKVTA
ncbi:MAG: hypothetical protein PUF72_05535 [Clostridiales bacterium]|nr:hypothetical protein [Clostridiales bacterium]